MTPDPCPSLLEDLQRLEERITRPSSGGGAGTASSCSPRPAVVASVTAVSVATSGLASSWSLM
jgi:hypothetical protein